MGEYKKQIRNDAKDSVFGNLFSDKKYVLELYRALHPEDTKVTMEMITDVTIEKVMAKGIFNDMGFTVRSRRLILLLWNRPLAYALWNRPLAFARRQVAFSIRNHFVMEKATAGRVFQLNHFVIGKHSQSTYTENIVVRMLFYLAETWRRHIRDTKQNHYGETKVSLPLPELYVIYTGGKKNHPDTLNLKDCFFPGEACPVNLQVKILYGTPYPDGTVSDKKGDIIWEFVTFCQVFNETVVKGGYTRKSMLEAIRICIERNVLREYLEQRESEVLDIMMYLFDQEEITKMLIQDERRKQAEETAQKMLQRGKMTVSEIAEDTGLTVAEIEELEETMLQKA